MHNRERAVACAALLALLSGCAQPGDHSWDWNRMRKQPRLDTYERVEGLPMGGRVSSGAAMRPPPPGTVAWGHDSAALQQNGAPLDLQQGRVRYEIFCAVCHGTRGDGQSVMRANFDEALPPSLLTATARALSDQRMFDVVTMGFNRMPPFGGEMSARDRWNVVGYLRQFQQQTPSPPLPAAR